ncbi:hypothetical protein DXG01_003183 [Tephrocybe rancida]|nr:hypothetical protein DXG01_003183 [Tephrocybe rancida]
MNRMLDTGWEKIETATEHFDGLVLPTEVDFSPPDNGPFAVDTLVQRGSETSLMDVPPNHEEDIRVARPPDDPLAMDTLPQSGSVEPSLVDIADEEDRSRLLDNAFAMGTLSELQSDSGPGVANIPLMYKEDSHASEVPDTVEKAKDSEYYLEMVVLEVENTLYRVPKYLFGTCPDFVGKEEPIQLDGVKNTEFRALLNLLQPLTVAVTRTFSKEEWISILKLSTKWKLLDIRNLAIKQLSLANMAPVDMVVLARQFAVPTLLMSAYSTLVQREAALSPAERTKLGIETAFCLFRARASLRDMTMPFDDVFCGSQVDQAFQEELCTVGRTPVERALLATTYGVREWVESAYLELVKQVQPLSDGEAATLGGETTIRICRARGRRILQPNMSSFSRILGQAHNINKDSLRTIVENELRVELDRLSSRSPIVRLVLARDYGVVEWIRSALVDLVKQGSIAFDEAKDIGFTTAIELYRIREQRSTFIQSGMLLASKLRIERELGQELSEIREAAKVYCSAEEIQKLEEEAERARQAASVPDTAEETRPVGGLKGSGKKNKKK